MFYSQFILAKKGPLGTIWIAAHLERKLRKNQVADTDIGVSVDSILFPDVPIALRLSSHLLLGVVRIYSRKVNYLFDDCSEALLKIKQAFRSTAVDLPPEESTAPYHSITLPETFDLDDFELPDNDILQGNYVDHHISTREQITLQDTMEGVVYSTSQFGLDERFGDGDTSQVGLDLEEDIFLDKAAAPVLPDVSEANSQASVRSTTCPEQDMSHDMMIESPDAITVNSPREKVECQDVDYAQAPSTPGLVEEPNLSSVQKGLACDDQLELEDHNLTEVMGVESSENASIKSDLFKNDAMDSSLGNHLNHDADVCIPTVENGCVSGGIEINQAMTQEDLPSGVLNAGYMPADGTAGSYDGPDKVEYAASGAECINGPHVASLSQTNSSCKLSLEVKVDKMDVENIMEESLSNLNDKSVASNAASPLEVPGVTEIIIEAQSCQGPGDPEYLHDHVDNENMTSTSMGMLRACNSSLTQPEASFNGIGDNVLHTELQPEGALPSLLETSGREEVFHASETSTKVQGEECDANAGMESVENQMLDPTLPAEIQAAGRHLEPLDNAATYQNQTDNLHHSVNSDLPAPEKLLSAPQMLLDNPNDLLLDSTPEKVPEEDDGSIHGTKTTGKKRTFTESALTVQSLDSVESFGMSKSKRTKESIPDDDDLLSSILVGRRSSVLKMKSTPRVSEMASVKRTRSASRPSNLKRKVLMDDSMVLLGDIIRQQLTSTEDIRRFRKKAPCTCTEILMIQRQFLEGEIFSEPVLTGMSAELVCLHKEAFDVSRIRVSENIDNNAPVEVEETESSPVLFVGQFHESEGRIDPMICKNDANREASDFPVQSESRLVEDPHLGPCDIDSQGDMDAIANVDIPRTSGHEKVEDTNEVDVDGGKNEVADATNHNRAQGSEASQIQPDSVDICSMPALPTDLCGLVSEIVDADSSPQMGTVSLPSDKMDTQPVEEGDVAEDLSNGKGLDGIEVIEHHTDHIVSVGNELVTREGIFHEGSKFDESLEIRDHVQEYVSAPTGDIEVSLANASMETSECINQSSVNADEATDDFEKGEVRVGNEVAGEVVILGHDEKNQISSQLCDDEFKTDSIYPVEHGEDFRNATLHDGDFPGCERADQQITMDLVDASLEHVLQRDTDSFQDAEFANNTEFLNVDDDEVDEDDDGMQGTDDARLLENSGWSSRSRAVANYLQTLFDAEGGHGRKVLLMDNLLAGKTRKEASRMFFETLVLKTRDYIHVEQVKPFDNINIKPRGKLMKSDF